MRTRVAFVVLTAAAGLLATSVAAPSTASAGLVARAQPAAACPSNADGSALPGDLTGQGGGHTMVGLPSRNQIEDIGPAGERWHLIERHTNVAATSDPAIGFGSAILLANINGDRCVDLVVGAPHTGASASGPDRGAVDILLMTPTLPDTTSVVRIDGPQAGSRFGSALAMTRRGNVRDLWVGAPGYSTPAGAGVGAVLRYTITAGSAPVLAQTILNTAPVAGDHFGAVLDSGTGLTSTANPAQSDSFVLVGTPDRTVGGQAGAGEVEWIRSLNTTGAGSIATTLNESGTTTTVERGDHFGASIAAGDVGQPTLIGCPGEDIRTVVDAGLLGLTTLPADASRPFLRTYDQSRYNIGGTAEAGDQFAASVALDPTVTTPDGQLLALVGVPGEDVGRVRDAGQVQRFWVHPQFEPDELTPVLVQGAAQLKDRVEAGDRVGASLSLRLLDSGTAPAGTLAPVIGIPGESGASTPSAGILADSTDRTGQAPWRLFGYSGGAVTGLHYGAVLGRLA